MWLSAAKALCYACWCQQSSVQAMGFWELVAVLDGYEVHHLSATASKSCSWENPGADREAFTAGHWSPDLLVAV